MFSLPSQPRINVDRAGDSEIYRLKITLFSSKTLPLTGLPQDKVINDIDLNPSLTSTSFRTTKILCSWSTVKLAKPQNYLCVREKKRVHIAHWCFREIRARFYLLHFRESRPDYHVPRMLVDHANLVHRRCGAIGQHREDVRLVRVTQALGTNWARLDRLPYLFVLIWFV